MIAFKGSQNTADIHAVMGSTGTGKGRYIKTELLPRYAGRQVFAWSPLEKSDNYAAVLKCRAVESLAEMIAAYRDGKSCVYVPPKNEPKRFTEAFSVWCRAVGSMPGCVALVEEMSRVTSPSYAPPAWSDLSTACRHEGITLIGAAQRPAQVDKDFLGGATEIRGFRVGYENDARVMSQVLREPWENLMELPDFYYVHRFVKERRSVCGVLGERQKVAQKTTKKPPIEKKVAGKVPANRRKTP